MMDGLLQWAILYHDGTVFANAPKPPGVEYSGGAWLFGQAHEARRSGVQQVFYCSDSTGVSVETSRVGIWVMRADMWMGLDEERSLWDYMFHEWPLLAIYGRTLPDKQWEGDVHRLTLELMNTPKSAWRARERRY